MRRNISRVKVLFKLYQNDLLKTNENIDEFDKLLSEIEDTDEVIDYDKKFSEELYQGVNDNLSKIDRTIAISLTVYPFDRLSYVDRNLLRIGTYELLFTKTPKEIIINEIIELSKEYSQTDDFLSSKFNNSVLDNICKRLKL